MAAAATAISIICNFPLHSHTSILLNISFPPSVRSRKSCFFRFSRICVVSSHTNPKILKPKRRSRYGQPLSPYDSDSDEDDDDSFEDEEDDDISTSDVSFNFLAS